MYTTIIIQSASDKDALLKMDDGNAKVMEKLFYKHNVEEVYFLFHRLQFSVKMINAFVTINLQ